MNFQDNLFQKNAELWQQFSNSYTENLFTIFEKSLAQSQTLQRQVQEAVTTAVNSQFELTRHSIKALETQVASLAAKLDEVLAVRQ
ncbi:MAG: hypothetical protein AB1791_12585 [Chloroflexota bacterium]